MLRLVGVAVAGNETVAASTKVGPTIEDRDWTRLLIRSLARYGASLTINDPDHALLSPPVGDRDGSLIALARWLLEDYHWNGLYKRTHRRRTFDGNGSPDWPRTIETRLPLVSRGVPVHLEPITERGMIAPNDLVSMAHKRVLEEASERFGSLLALSRIDLSHEPIGEIQRGTAGRALAAGLRRELRQVFDDRGLRLVRALISWLERATSEGDQQVHLYGSGAFHVVWERACRDILGDELSLWMQAVPRPRWASRNDTFEEAETLRPDVIVRDGDRMSIVDAKYYRITWPPALEGQPGVGDVTKQIMYRRVLLPEARKRGVKHVGNVFVVPNASDHDAPLALDGHVKLGERAGMRVDVLSIGIRRALSLYVSQRQVTEGERRTLLSL